MDLAPLGLDRHQAHAAEGNNRTDGEADVHMSLLGFVALPHHLVRAAAVSEPGQSSTADAGEESEAQQRDAASDSGVPCAQDFIDGIGGGHQDLRSSSVGSGAKDLLIS